MGRRLEGEGNAAAPTYVPSRRSTAWQDEAPTRRVHAQTTLDVESHPDPRDSGSVSDVRTRPPPIGLEKAPAAFDGAQVRPEWSAPSAGGPPSAPPPTDFGRRFESMRPPAPSLSEVVVDVRAERRPRRRIGWVAVTLAVSVSMCIIAAAVVARVRELTHAAPDSAEVLDARPAALMAGGPVVPTGQTLASHRAPDTGELQLTTATRGQPIFVDGHPVAVGPGDIRLSCGRHAIRVGSPGTSQMVVVPCGGSLTLSP